MVKDIAPELIHKIRAEFSERVSASQTLAVLAGKLRDGKATYLEANQYAIRAGEILSEVLMANISSAVLPDGRMYYNIAERLLGAVLSYQHDMVSDYAVSVQELLNRSGKIGLKVQQAGLNRDRVDGLVNRLASELDFDKVSWILGEPIVTFSQSVIDDTIKANSDWHARVGLSPKIVRKEAGNCCQWCKAVIGVYSYPDVPKDVWRRHNRCKCTVDYHPGNGKMQNVHSKGWSDPRKNAKIEQRKEIGLLIQSGAQHYFRDSTLDFLKSKEEIRKEEHAYKVYDTIKNSDQALEKRKIFSNLGRFKEMRDFSKRDVDLAFDHIFNLTHKLEAGEVLFAPDPDMARSWERLISGKGIEAQDLLMLRHERLENDYMYGSRSLPYAEAHRLANDLFDFEKAMREIKRKG